MTAAEKRAEADRLEARAKELRAEAAAADKAALAAKPLLERMCFAAYARCECGAGMAYDKAVATPYGENAKWQCSAIIRFEELPADEQARAKAATHTPPLPFAFYDVKGENQPSANGATTRPQA